MPYSGHPGYWLNEINEINPVLGTLLAATGLVGLWQLYKRGRDIADMVLNAIYAGVSLVL